MLQRGGGGGVGLIKFNEFSHYKTFSSNLLLKKKTYLKVFKKRGFAFDCMYIYVVNSSYDLTVLESLNFGMLGNRLEMGESEWNGVHCCTGVGLNGVESVA